MVYKHFLLTLFRATYTFTACSEEDNKITEEEKNRDEFVFVEVYPIQPITDEK